MPKCINSFGQSSTIVSLRNKSYNVPLAYTMKYRVQRNGKNQGEFMKTQPYLIMYRLTRLRKERERERERGALKHAR